MSFPVILARPSVLIHILGITLAVVMTSLLYAQSDSSSFDGHIGPHHPTPEACAGDHLADLGVVFDADQDGWLDPTEHHAMMEARRSADLQAYDRDRDGQLSSDEFLQLHHDRTVERFEAADANGDATISHAEAIASCPRLVWPFLHIDRDRDGAITWAEFEQASRRLPLPDDVLSFSEPIDKP